METIISTAITMISTLLVCLVNNHYQAKGTRTLIEYKIEELSKKVEKHNRVIERVYSLEQNQAVICEQIKVANHRIEDLEEIKS